MPDLAATAVAPNSIEATIGGPLRVVDPIEETPDAAPSVLATMRENTTLNLIGESFFRWRCCGGPLARPWIHPCSPRYTGQLGQPGTERFDPNVNGGGITSVLDADHKCVESCWARSQFVPFTFYNLQDVDCQTPTFDLQTEARLQIQRNTAWWLTAELDHSPLSGNPSLRSFGWDLTPASGAVSPAQALIILMRAYRSQGMGGLVLHVPWEALVALETARLITARGGVYRTVSGITVAAGPGYSGVLPELDATGATKATPPDPALPGQGEIAFYATRSVVEYNLGAVEDYPLEVLQRDVRTNHRNAESYRTAALRFDPGCVYAVAVNLDQGVC